MSSAIQIRPARAEEQRLLRRLVWKARLDPTQLAWPNFLVATEGVEVVGIGQLRPFGEVQELGSLVVRSAWQGQGIGGQLVRALIARRSCPLYLECATRLAPYYQRFGFYPLSWREVPWPLKGKFALSSGLARLAGQRVQVMHYRE